jgi:DNA-binding transcriptional ArsR family regulator
MFTFLRALGLQPIEWSEAVALAPGASPYIGEILDHAFELAMAVVVLLTGDDEARLRPQLSSGPEDKQETILTPQARPNVLFEAGLAFGVHPERTILVELGTLRPFSDIGGRHVIRMSNATEARQNLARRLQKAGCEANLLGTDWHSAGDFESALFADPPRPIPQAHPGGLEPVRVEILKFLSTIGVDKTASVDEVALGLQIHPQKVLHHLEWLVEKDYVYDILLMGNGARYGLDTQGRTYLIQSGSL